MESVRTQSWCCFIVILVLLIGVRCDAASSSDTTLTACNYASENLYTVNASDPQPLFPMGYVECANATGNDVVLCEVCSCREKKVASVEGVPVAWVVCVGVGDATACGNIEASGQEYCESSSGSSIGVAGSASYSQDSSSSSEDSSVNVGDPTSGSSASTSVTDGSDGSAEVIPASKSSSGTSGSVDNASGSSVEFDPVVTLLPGSESQAENEDNVITGDVSTIKPTQTRAATSSEQNIIRPSDNGSGNQLDTSNGISSFSIWPGKQLTVLVSILCGIAAIAAVAVFVAVRKDQARKKKALGTPVRDFTDDESSLATPMTHRLDGRYHHGRKDSRYYSNDLASSKAPLADIVVIGPDDESRTPSDSASAHQYRSYSRNHPDTERCVKVSQDNAATGDSRCQFEVSNGPSMSGSTSSRPDPIYDTHNTQLSFSSSMSSEYDSPVSIYASEESFVDSFRVVSANDSESSKSEGPQKVDEVPDYDTSDTFAGFASSLSSLDSSQYDIRDTEASEYMHDSEDGMLNTNSSRVAMSFDVGSVSPQA